MTTKKNTTQQTGKAGAAASKPAAKTTRTPKTKAAQAKEQEEKTAPQPDPGTAPAAAVEQVADTVKVVPEPVPEASEAPKSGSKSESSEKKEPGSDEDWPAVVLAGAGSDLDLLSHSLAMWSTFLPGRVRLLGIGLDIPLEVEGKDPVKDYFDQLMAAVASDRVPERFVFVPAETFPVSAVDLAALEALKAWSLESRKSELGGLQKALHSRLRRYYPAILPLVVEKEKVAEVVEHYHLHKHSLSFPTVYNNHFHPDAVPFMADVSTSVLAVVTRANPNLEKVEQLLAERMFFHCNKEGLDAIAALLKKQTKR